MKNRINLSKFNVRTDLVIDNEIKDSYINKKKITDNILITNIDVNDELGIELNKKAGSYVTIEFEDITNYEDSKEIVEVLNSELNKLLNSLFNTSIISLLSSKLVTSTNSTVI